MPRPVARCASRLAQAAVELILQLQLNEARDGRPPSQLRGDSSSGPCGRRVPPSEDSGAGCGLSKQHNADPARILKGVYVKRRRPSAASQTDALQPFTP